VSSNPSFHRHTPNERDHVVDAVWTHTCVPAAHVVLHVVLLHADEVTDAAAEREHPLLLVHMERHVADKLGIQLRLEITHMAAGQRTERKDGENSRQLQC